MFPVPADGAGITIGRADQRDAHVMGNTRHGPRRIIECRCLRPGDISGLHFPVFIHPQLDAAFEILGFETFGGSGLDIAGQKNKHHKTH